MKTKTKTRIRMMIDRDIPRLLALDAAKCPQTPLTEKHFRDCIKLYRSWTPLVIEHGGELRSFCIMQHDRNDLILFRLIANPVGAWHDCFAIYLDWLKAHGNWRRIIVDLPERDVETQIVFRRMGLYCTRIERGAYDDDPADIQAAYVFEYRRSTEG